MDKNHTHETSEGAKVINTKHRNKLHSFRENLPSDKKRLILLGLIVLAIPLTVILALYQQELRSRASEFPATPATPPSPTTYGQALSITSSNNAYIRSTNSGSVGNFSNFTIEALAYYVPSSTNIDYPIVSKMWNINSGEKMPFNLNITKDGHLSFIYTVKYNGVWSNTELRSKSVLSSNTFHHLAVVYDGSGYGTLSLYIDGYKDISVPLTGIIAGGSNGDVIIGWQNSTKFNGIIDEVRISNIPRYYGDHYATKTEPFINDAATLLLYKFDNNIYDTTGKTSGTAVAGTAAFTDSISSPFVYPVKDYFTLTPSEENVTMPVSAPNSSYGIYAILKNNGEVVKDQSNYEYHWLSGNLVTLQPFSACSNGIVEPCPMDHASLTANTTGSTIITLVVAKKGVTNCNGSDCIARVNFNVKVVAGPTVTPTPTKAPFRIVGKHVDANGNLMNLTSQNVTITNLSTNQSQVLSGSNWSIENLPRADYKITSNPISGYKIEHMVCYECMDQDRFFPSNTFILGQTSSDYVGVTFRYISAPSPTSAILTPSPTPKRVILNPNADAFVRSTAPNQNFGTAANLENDLSPDEISYLRFNLSTLAGKTIKSATLVLWTSDATNSTLNLRRAENKDWSEGGINYNNRPSFVSTITSINAKTVNSRVKLDVKNPVNNLKGSRVTFGIKAIADDSGAFYSRNSLDASKRPQLIVEYY